MAADTVRAMRPDSKPGGLDFLIGRDRIVGPLASRYRSVGIFTVVAGVDDSTWVQGFADGVSTMQLLEAEEGIAPPAANQAIPSPVTLGLLVIGLALLPRRRITVPSTGLPSAIGRAGTASWRGASALARPEAQLGSRQ